MANPHHTGELAERYATAILELAQEQKSVEAVERDLKELAQALRTKRDLARFVRSPIFSRDDQVKGMRAVLQASGASALTTRFVLTLASKRRLFALLDIIRVFETHLAKLRGEVDATVISAHALSDAQSADLKSAIKSRLGREPRLALQVDPSLLGGIVVKVGSRMVDTSLRSKLNGIRLAMRGNSRQTAN
ncbi:MAG: F0F1 ATP synthase subunit delta [Alphaproteobacteria bacterium]|nr:F0F1 ATP synthase subunit delta [Alphaproteobacteria bacterium]